MADRATISTRYGEFTRPDGLLEYLRILKEPYVDVSFAITSVQLDGAMTVTWRMTGSLPSVASRDPSIIADVTQHGAATIVFQNGTLAHFSSRTQVTAFTERVGATVVAVPHRGQAY